MAKKSTVKPHFVPAGITFETLPRILQILLTEVIQPLYEDTVIEAATAMERQAGVTLCFLLWQECLLQIQTGGETGNSNGQTSPQPLDEKKIALYVRIAGAKQKAADFLLRYEIFRTKYQEPLWTYRQKIEEMVTAMDETAPDAMTDEARADDEGHSHQTPRPK